MPHRAPLPLNPTQRRAGISVQVVAALQNHARADAPEPPKNAAANRGLRRASAARATPDHSPRVPFRLPRVATPAAAPAGRSTARHPAILPQIRDLPTAGSFADRFRLAGL